MELLLLILSKENKLLIAVDVFHLGCLVIILVETFDVRDVDFFASGAVDALGADACLLRFLLLFFLLLERVDILVNRYDLWLLWHIGRAGGWLCKHPQSPEVLVQFNDLELFLLLIARHLNH